ncbi:MAG: exo-alpha-sialidase [Gammaproteobacteria bacterium]|nr:exo-alpha-sialidase [Gammaproteobacteria bacterium]NIR99248.1 exo-alpha-sialidase [Gammaproteobacteria bacterium]NIT64869.1 exo-alpha-sialidase [Gammaproteobacteria bacterium]NIX10888.1 exo-alpha-sialidase [Gammaproteobacteria bacterium]NIY33449.1 exo-alpha-sialidase [Gammaproteobacteria bacterium]
MSSPFAAVAGHGAAANPSVCTDPEAPAALRCALAPTPAFDGQGRLWVVWALGGHVYVSRSNDRGETFAAPVPVNRVPEHVAADGENRAKIGFGAGRIYVSWTRRLAKRYSGDVRFAYSADGGASFSEPITVNDNREITSHRFEAMGVAGERVYLAWLDKRDRTRTERGGGSYAGAALYYKVSENGGASFHPDAKIADHTCECCRVAMAMDGRGLPVIFWRHVFEPNVRDHAQVTFRGPRRPGTRVRVSHDDWRVDACPHHGPAISIADGIQHLVWFNNAPERHGLFYARSTDGGNSFSATASFGEYARGAAHPDVLGMGRRAYRLWKELDGQRSVLRVQISADAGTAWGPARTLARAEGESDHPLLVGNGAGVFAAWHRRGQPYRLLPIEAGDVLDEGN